MEEMEPDDAGQLDFQTPRALRRRCLSPRFPHPRLGPGELSRLGATDGELLRAYPSLTPADLEAAFAYAAANVEEIDRAISENEAGEEGLME